MPDASEFGAVFVRSIHRAELDFSSETAVAVDSNIPGWHRRDALVLAGRHALAFTATGIAYREIRFSFEVIVDRKMQQAGSRFYPRGQHPHAVAFAKVPRGLSGPFRL
jgi:hypothetical protein